MPPSPARVAAEFLRTRHGADALLYRVGRKPVFTGPGSFWAENEDIADKYGRGATMVTIPLPRHRVALLDSDEDIENMLIERGLEPEVASDRVSMNDWMEDAEARVALDELARRVNDLVVRRPGGSAGKAVREP